MPYKDPDRARSAAVLRQRRYRANHTQTPEQRARAIEATRRWRELNPGKRKQASDNYRLRNPGVLAARTRQAKLADLNRRYTFARNAARKRAAAKGLPFEDIDLEALAARDSWQCHICLGPVDREIMDRHNPWNMSIDHLVPESQGGGWTWDNLRLSHYGCNILRGTSTLQAARAFAHEFMRRLSEQAQLLRPRRPAAADCGETSAVNHRNGPLAAPSRAARGPFPHARGTITVTPCRGRVSPRLQHPNAGNPAERAPASRCEGQRASYPRTLPGRPVRTRGTAQRSQRRSGRARKS